MLHVLKSFAHSVHDKMFSAVHGSRLVYNMCWEDPRLDRQIMNIGPESRIVVLSSAGCNALDYLLDGPAAVHCVDMNHRQNALVEFKKALFAAGDPGDLRWFFGQGAHPAYLEAYGRVRGRLPQFARDFWDSKISYFNPETSRGSFYYHGTSGDFAYLFLAFLRRTKKSVIPRMYHLLEAESLAEQREIYDEIEPLFFGAFTSWLVRQPAVMTLLGVPRPQIRLIDTSHPGGLSAYVKDKLRHVFTELPVKDNYFWRCYVTGSYTEHCCPEYLKKDNFTPLAEQIGNLHTHTDTVSGFLQNNPGQYTHFVLLDHQDWMAHHAPDALNEEWELIFANAAPGAQVMMRSAGLDLSFVPEQYRERIDFDEERTAELHKLDRVGTYGSFHSGTIKGA